jgi:hypothetical protein
MREIVRLENIRPRSLDELSEELEISKPTVCKYRKMLRDNGAIKTANLPEGIPWYFASITHFKDIGLIKEYVERLKINKNNVSKSIAPLFTICKMTNVHPEEFKDSVQKSERIYTKFVNLWKDKDADKLLINHDKAIRKFLGFLGHKITKENKAFYADNSVGGDYAHVRLSDNEFRLGLDFMEKEGGNEYRNLFGIHHETFVRPITLFKPFPRLEMQFLEEQGKVLEYAQLTVVETKQGTRYDKLIIDPKVLEMTFELKSNQPIVSEPKVVAEKKYADLLRLFYHEIGKIEPNTDYKRGEEGWLYFNRPLYTIRHSSAHMWMRRTNYNADLVASMGWEDSKTLLTYYSRVSTKSIMSAGACQFCRPPMRDTGEFSFCSASHSLAYLNGLKVDEKVGT